MAKMPARQRGRDLRPRLSRTLHRPRRRHGGHPPIAEAAGFTTPPDDQTNQPGATFYRTTDNASISLRLGVTTSIIVTTGCHKGHAFTNWPAGTEAVPDYLRTTGHAPSPDEENGHWTN